MIICSDILYYIIYFYTLYFIIGFVSFKNNLGSYFIQCLCDVLAEHAKNKHLMDMLTVVTRRIAFYFESSNDKDASKDRKKQVPYTTSTLTKYVKFPSWIILSFMSILTAGFSSFILWIFLLFLYCGNFYQVIFQNLFITLMYVQFTYF